MTALCTTASPYSKKLETLVLIAVLAGGNGGGRPDSAMGGAGDPEKIAEALTRLPELI